MTRFPAWLPTAIAAHAERLLDSGAVDQDSEARSRLIRLTSDAGMEKVWRTLSRASPDDVALIDFLDRVRLHPAVIGPRTSPSALSPAQQKALFKRIAKLAHALLEQLRLLGGNAPESGLGVLESALHRADMAALRLASSGPIRLPGLPSIVDDDQPLASPVEVLTAFARSAELAACAPPPPGPRKQKAHNVMRTAYVQDISDFVERCFAKPFPAVVAATISVSLNDTELSEDLVRKLTRPKRSIPSKKSK